jgi:hypothetical protein
VVAAIDELNRAVVPDQQAGGQLADGRAAGIGVDAQDQQHLVLGRGQAGRSRLLLAPAEEPPQRHPEGEQVLVLPIVHRRFRHPSWGNLVE